MSHALVTHDVLYFGKLPSRGDFVRSQRHGAVVDSLDQWQTRMMERLAMDPRWKLVYDTAPPTYFALMGVQSKVALAGHWLASQDASGRRFPFLTATAFDVTEPVEFMRHSSLALSRVWGRLEQIAKVSHAATDMSVAQISLRAGVEMDPRISVPRMELLDFLETHSVASLEQMLASHGGRVSVRQVMLAMGLLLQPVMGQGASRLQKGLRLPLVNEPGLRACLASFWLSLVLGFFRQIPVELCVLVNQLDGMHRLYIGFQGASASSLCAAIDTEAMCRDTVDVTDAEWVESCAAEDYGLRKLSNYLRDPGLSLAQALRTFEEVFLGV